MVCGPEVARAVSEFEAACVLKKQEKTEFRHHEDTPSFQKRFLRNVDNLKCEFQKLGNPFSDTYGDELLQICSRDVMNATTIETIRNIETIGMEQYQAFITERLKGSAKDIDDSIKKNKLPLFNSKSLPKQPSKAQIQQKSLKNDIRIFSQLYIATQTRDGDLDTFFSHENSSHPPSLSCDGKLS